MEGKIRYQLEPLHEDEQLAAAGDKVVIEAEVPHHVEFIEPNRFYVEFYRRAKPSSP